MDQETLISLILQACYPCNLRQPRILNLTLGVKTLVQLAGMDVKVLNHYVGLAKRVVKTETNLPALTALSAAGNSKEKNSSGPLGTGHHHWVGPEMIHYNERAMIRVLTVAAVAWPLSLATWVWPVQSYSALESSWRAWLACAAAPS